MYPFDATQQPEIVGLPPLSLPSPPLKQVLYDKYRATHTPIVIDNGSTTLRWGFADFDKPYTGINAVSKYKERKNNRLLVLFGDAIDTESGARGQARTPWEGDVLLNFDALVHSALCRKGFTDLHVSAGKLP